MRQQGFSLLEVLLALALAATSLLAMQQLWLAFGQRAQWWQALAQESGWQAELQHSLTQLHARRCQAGLLAADEEHWQLKLDLGSGCMTYDVRFDGAKRQLKRRRQGGRYTSMHTGIRHLTVRYGLATEGECVPRLWQASVLADQAAMVVLMQIQMAVELADTGVGLQLPDHWQQAEDKMVLIPVRAMIALGCNKQVAGDDG